jgi:lysophospholipase L1-like esterase
MLRMKSAAVRMCLGFAILSAALCLAQAPAGSPADESLQKYRANKQTILKDDFGELGRYRDADAKVSTPAAGEKRVVFYGDSITDVWKLDESFPGKPYIGRGIGGQTTPQMLVRFRQDVINLHPKVVVILAGTNDIAGNTGPMTLEQIEGNYTSLAELARANKIRVVFSSVLPIHNYTPKSENFFAQRSPEKILELNKWLKAYCATHGDVYLDYFNAMVDDKGMMKKDLAEDGLHPNKEGYALMALLAEGAIKKALGSGEQALGFGLWEQLWEGITCRWCTRLSRGFGSSVLHPTRRG